MATYTIQPNAVTSWESTKWLKNSESVNPTAAQFVSLVNDGTDTTWLTFQMTSPGSPGNTTSIYGLAAPSIASGEFVCRVSGWFRTRYGAMDAARVQFGVQPYRMTDTQPASFSVITGNGTSSTWVYKEPAYWTVAWTPTECSTLSLAWYANDTGSFTPRAQFSEIGAKIYTLAPGTSTPSNTTMTAVSYPTIPVAIAATIDWEASTTDAQGLRKVTTEVMVRSGSSSPTTGTLVATETYDKMFTSTGTQNVNVVFTTPIANGTYQVYARSIRHREGETSIGSDQYGAWSSAATLTMNVPLPNTPTASVTVQQADSRIKITVTPVTTSGYSSPVIDVERSDDNGTTWKAVRNAVGVAGSFGVAKDIFDYFPPKGQTVYYRARVRAQYSGGAYNPSAWTSSMSAIIYAVAWTLRDLDNPSIGVSDLRVIGDPEETMTEDVGVFRPLNARYPTVVSGELSGWDGSLEVVCISNAEWATLRGVLERQTPLVLESLYGWVKVIRVIGGAKVKSSGSATQPVRTVTFSYVELEGV